MNSARKLLRGLILIFLLAVISIFSVREFGLARYGISALTLAIVLGAVLGNVLPSLSRSPWHFGVRFSQRTLLRVGVSLYGFNLSLQQIAEVGGRGIWVDTVMVCSTLALGWFVGTRILKLDRETVLLASAGSAICGAAAVVATAPVLRMDEQREAASTSAAVATVILFGTLAIFIYPALYAWLGIVHTGFGTYIGSTVHEVAQVVAIGNLIGDDAERTAVIVKMIRVMMLVPFLLFISSMFRGPTSGGKPSALTIPWFAIAFLAFAGVNSLQWIPGNAIGAFRILGSFSLTMAMAALGIDTNVSRLRQSGPKVFLLGAILFLHLLVFGALINFPIVSGG